MPRRKRRDKLRSRASLRDLLTELESGPGLALALAMESESGRISMFDSDEDRRQLWSEWRDRLIAERSAKRPGDRPWAFWHYEAGDADLAFASSGERRLEALRYLASTGQLTTGEREALAAAGAEAAERIETDGERGTLRHKGCEDCPLDGTDRWCSCVNDRLAVAVAVAVDRP